MNIDRATLQDWADLLSPAAERLLGPRMVREAILALLVEPEWPTFEVYGQPYSVRFDGESYTVRNDTVGCDLPLGVGGKLGAVKAIYFARKGLDNVRPLRFAMDLVDAARIAYYTTH